MITRRSLLGRTAILGVAGLASLPTHSVLSQAQIKDGTSDARTVTIPNTDIVVSRMAYGPGGTLTNMASRVRTAYDHGITFFDVADMYEFGKVETELGAVLKQSPGLRDRIILQSKCGIPFSEDSRQNTVLRVDCSREHILKSVDGSLRRLGTDRLDILLLHWPDALVEPVEVAEAFDQLKRAGKVRYFGVSNHTASQIMVLQEALHQPVVANQIYLNLEISSRIAGGLTALWSVTNSHDYTEIPGTLDYCRRCGIQVQAYGPTPQVLLNPPADATPEVKHAAQVLADLAAKKQVTAAAVGLAWLLRHPAQIVPIIGASNLQHIAEDCAAMQIQLSHEEWYDLLIATSSIKKWS